MTDALPQTTLAAFVGAMAQDRPAPGAGSAAAIALAMGAACAAKAFRISARHTADETLARAAERADALTGQAIGGAQADIDDFTAMIHAHSDPAPARALQADGAALLALIDALNALVAEHQPAVIPIMAGDLTAALALADAASRIQQRNLADAGSNR